MMKKLLTITAMWVLFAPSAYASDFLSISTCRELGSLPCDDFLRVDPMFLDNCMMAGSSPPDRCKRRTRLRQGTAVPTYFAGINPPQEPPGTGGGGGGGGGGILDLLGGLLQGLPFAIPPSLPDLFNSGGGSNGGGAAGTGPGGTGPGGTGPGGTGPGGTGPGGTGPGGTGPGGSGTGTGAGGGSGAVSDHVAEDTHRCELYGETSEIPQVTGSYNMPCGAAIELTNTAYTFDTNVQFVGHVEANKSVLKLYRRQNETAVVDGASQVVGSKYVFHQEVKFPSYYCKGASVYSETVALRPVEQFFAIGDNTTQLPIRLFPDDSPFTTAPYDPLTGTTNTSAATGALNYNYLSEFIIIQRSGNSFTPVGSDCDTRTQLLSGMPSTGSGFTVTTDEASVATCSVQTLPMTGSCEPDVMWMNQDDSSFLVQPNSKIQLHDIVGLDHVVVEAPPSTITYLGDGAYIYLPWGSGPQAFGEGAELTYDAQYHIYIPPPGQLEIRSDGGVILPNGGTLYHTNNDVAVQDYAAGTALGRGNDSAYRVRPIGAFALPDGIMAVSKTAGSIRLPEDK